MKIIYISTWPPRQSGISTYTYDLAKGIAKNSKISNWHVIAVAEDNKTYHYDNRVIFEIKQNHRDDYIKAAEMINRSDFDIVSLQHEFNLFGGDLGIMILELLKRIHKPVIITLHSIPLHLQSRRRKEKIKIIKKLEPYCAFFVTAIKFGKKILIGKTFNFEEKKIKVLHHGSPNFNFIAKEKAKKEIGYPNNFIVSSYGLINDRKGYDDLINAMVKIIVKNPKIILFLWGRMHPGLDISYYEKLQKLVKSYHLEKNVFFKNKYLSINEINLLLSATDVFAVPIWNLGLGSSGTLTYAMSAGKCILSTPFVHAKEDLSQNRGIIVPVKNPRKIAEEILLLADNKDTVKKYENKMKKFDRKFSWDKIGKEYYKILKEIIE